MQRALKKAIDTRVSKFLALAVESLSKVRTLVDHL